MAQNTVQYQRGLSLPEFFDQYGSHERCEGLVRAWRWPEGFICPRCQCRWHSEFRRQQRLYFQCSGCRYQCSLVAGTVFESSKVPLTSWFLAMHLMTQAKNNVSALELKRHLGALCRFVWNATVTVWPRGSHPSPRPSRQREGGESPSAVRVASQKCFG
jgi:hypothetical protein